MHWIELKAVVDCAAAAVSAKITADAKTRAQWKVAVSKLQDAVVETQLYVSSIDRGQSINRSVEEKLVDLWRVAATGFYALDGPLAERLQLKAEYWTQPESWTSQQVRDAGIALQRMAEYTRQLLYEGK